MSEYFTMLREADLLHKEAELDRLRAELATTRTLMKELAKERLEAAADTAARHMAELAAKDTRIAASLRDEAERCIQDIVPGDEIGAREARARASALLTAAGDIMSGAIPDDNEALRTASEELHKCLAAMVNRWEPDTEGLDRVMWENACEALGRDIWAHLKTT